jgi:hypothetical protein
LVIKRDLKRGQQDEEEENEDVSISTRLKN